MPSRSNWTTIVALVNSKKELQQFQSYLLSPDKVQDLIVLANSGKVRDAMEFVERAELLLLQIQETDGMVDLTWDFDVLKQIRKALNMIHREQE